METKFKVGDTVQLKSGGPIMTVSGFFETDGPRVKCTWFEDKLDQRVLQEASFPAEALEAIDPRP